MAEIRQDIPTIPGVAQGVDSSNPTSTNNSSTADLLPDTKQEENTTKISKKGRLAGGTFLNDLQGNESTGSENGPLTEVDIDMPLTLTEIITKDGQEYILLKFTDDDKQDPFNWSNGRKAWITLLLCLMTLFIGLATTAYSSGINSMVGDLGVSTELGQLGLFCFNMACALAPLFLTPFCELVGRRMVYVGAYALFVVCFIGLALGKNIATILVMRTLSGLFGCVGIILVGGTFSDIYRPDERATPMACFSYVAILGTVGAPIYAGFINETIGWRWIEGIQGLANIPLLLIILVSLRETRGGVTLHNRAKALRAATGDERYRAKMDLEAKNIKEMLHNSSVKAVHMLATEPVVFAFGLWIAFAWFVTFLFLSVVPITFQEKRGWSEGIAGLPYISLCIGVTIGFALNFLQIRKYKAILKSPDRKILPESRLYGAMFGAGFLPVGLFIYSFTQHENLSWIAPTIALAPISMGIFFIFESTYSFTSDCYGENSSSAIAGQGLMRNMLGAVAPLFANMQENNLPRKAQKVGVDTPTTEDKTVVTTDLSSVNAATPFALPSVEYQPDSQFALPRLQAAARAAKKYRETAERRVTEPLYGTFSTLESTSPAAFTMSTTLAEDLSPDASVNQSNPPPKPPMEPKNPYSSEISTKRKVYAPRTRENSALLTACFEKNDNPGDAELQRIINATGMERRKVKVSNSVSECPLVEIDKFQLCVQKYFSDRRKLDRKNFLLQAGAAASDYGAEDSEMSSSTQISTPSTIEAESHGAPAVNRRLVNLYDPSLNTLHPYANMKIEF
ncbi:hypothetical protein IFR05_013836 [Cadophora sp. M221]|nr:hypothetical protein IFR05_013836 [Cadophora sp. M221]